MKFKLNLKVIKKNIVVISVASSLALGALLYIVTRTEASPSIVVDTTTDSALTMTAQRRIVRTTSGTNGNRVFTAIQNGTDNRIYYSDNVDSATPTWSDLLFVTGTTYRVADMVWDESNDVIYMCYARYTLSDTSSSDVFYRRISNLGGSPPTLGAEQLVFNGTSGVGNTTFKGCQIEIGGDSGTTKVLIFTSGSPQATEVEDVRVRAGTINSDTPTWNTAYTIKSWTAGVMAGPTGVSRVNTNKLVLFYYDGVEFKATRHDDSAAIDATSGWDALDGTDNSQTLISTDTQIAYRGNGSVVASYDSDVIWFSWVDSADDINTRRWNGSSLDPEMVAVVTSSASAGGSLTTDGKIVYLAYRSQSATTQVVAQQRPLADGTSPWSGNTILLDTGVTYSRQMVHTPKKLYQGKLDVLSIDFTDNIVRHGSSLKFSGNIYQESASSVYEGSTTWSGCDGITMNVAISVAGAAKINTYCDASTGAYSFVLGQPTAADADFNVFIDPDQNLDSSLAGYWNLDESTANTCTGGEDNCDSTSFAHHGTWNGNATNTTGNFGNAVTFDGSGDYVAVAEADANGSLDLTSGESITVSAWINPTALPGAGTWATFAGKNAGGDGYYFQIDDAGKINFYIANTGYRVLTTNSAYVTTGSWQHIVFTQTLGDETTGKIYYNGTAVAATWTGDTPNVAPAASNLTFNIGANGDGSEAFNGKVDDVRIYNKLFSDYEASKLSLYNPYVGSTSTGALFTHNNDINTDISGITLYKNRIIVRSESATSITNADINSYDKSNDTHIPIASDGTNVVADLGTKIIINTGDTFAPGGNVTTPKLHIKGTYTGASETLIIYGSGSSSSCDDTLTNIRPLCIDGGTFTPTSNTTHFTASSPALIQNATYNTLVIKPGQNSVTHTLMAGTFTVNGTLTFGNGTNTGVIVTAATNSTTLTANSSLTISANTTFIANAANTTTVKGNWTNNGTFTHSSGTVSLAGADSSTQVIAGNTTFNNLSATTTANSAGRTISYTGNSTTTVAGTWTMNGASGKILTLQSTDTNSWTITPSSYSADYLAVSRSTNTVGTICATHSSDNGNNSGWTINGGASCSVNDFRMQTGYYVGSGIDNMSITGLGFQPDMVIVKDDTSNGSLGAIFKTSAMTGENSIALADSTGTIASDAIQSLDSDGFTLGTNADVNTQKIRYTWIAFSGSECSSAGTFCVGSYTGDGSSSHAITSVGWRADLVVVKSTGASSARFRTSSMATDVGQLFSATNEVTNGTTFRTIDSTGFTVGNSSGVNSNATVYYYFAFKNVANKFAVGTYTGDGLDNRSITGPGFQTQSVWVKNSNATTPSTAYSSITESSGDYSTTFVDSSNVTGAIKSLDATGFTVGTTAGANESGKTIYWVAFGGATTPTPSGTFTMKLGTYTGNGTTQSIGGVGFAPDLVIIKETTGADHGVFRIKLMKGDNTVSFVSGSSATIVGAITTLDNNGFTVGSDVTVNTNGTEYSYQAFGNAWNPETGTGAADFTIGAYTGNGIDNRSIIRLPFQPDILSIKRPSQTGIFRTSDMVGDVTAFYTNNADASDHIQGFGTNSFQVGTNARVNSVTDHFTFFAFKNGSKIKTGTYTGTGSAHNITSPGIQPDLVWVKSSAAVYGIFRPSTVVGDNSMQFTNLASLTDRITGLLSNGFSVGGNQTHSNSTGVNYWYIVWSAPAPLGSTLRFEGINATGINFN